MSEPAQETSPVAPPAEEPVTSAPRRQLPLTALAAAAAVAVVVVLIAAAPFWAPAVMDVLPWGEKNERTSTEIARPATPPPQAAPAAPAHDIAPLQAQATQNAAVLQQLTQRIAALESKPAPATPNLAPIEQQLGALAKTTADLGQRVAALDTAMRQPSAESKNTALALALLQIREAVATGRPFAAEYRALMTLAHDDKGIVDAVAALAAPAESGVASRPALTARLRQLAPQIATAQPAPDATWTSEIKAQLRSLITIRRVEPGAGQTAAEAAVAAAQRDMASGDLAGAVAALGGLTGPNRAAAEPWLSTAKQRLAVEAALRQVQTALTTAIGTTTPADKS